MWQSCQQCGKFTNLERENARQLESNFVEIIFSASYLVDIMDMRSFDRKGFRVATQGNSNWRERSF